MDRTAELAAEAAEGRRVEVLETGTAAGGLRIVALTAARLAAAGMPLPELAASVRGASERVEMLGMLETVELLARGGRVPQVARWGSSLLRVRPVIRFHRSRGSLVTLVRSPLRGVAAMARTVVEDARRQGMGPRGEGLTCSVFQADAEALAESLRERLREAGPAADLSVSEMTSAMAVHVGPGAVGVAWALEPAP
jgi:DegV family protein with EDD domain